MVWKRMNNKKSRAAIRIFQYGNGRDFGKARRKLPFIVLPHVHHYCVNCVIVVLMSHRCIPSTFVIFATSVLHITTCFSPQSYLHLCMWKCNVQSLCLHRALVFMCLLTAIILNNSVLLFVNNNQWTWIKFCPFSYPCAFTTLNSEFSVEFNIVFVFSMLVLHFVGVIDSLFHTIGYKVRFFSDH